MPNQPEIITHMKLSTDIKEINDVLKKAAKLTEVAIQTLVSEKRVLEALLPYQHDRLVINVNDHGYHIKAVVPEGVSRLTPADLIKHRIDAINLVLGEKV